MWPFDEVRVRLAGIAAQVEAAQNSLQRISAVQGKQGTMIARLVEGVRLMATQDQIDQLTAAVNGAADRISTGIDGVRQDIADLKAANPAVDVSALEASVGRLAGEADQLAALDAENPPAAPTV